MKTSMLSLLGGLVVLGVGMGSVQAGSECPPGTFTRVIGSVVTSNANSGDRSITDSGAQVRRVTVSCGGTACVATLYDSDGGSPTEVETADVKAEPGCAANQSCTLDFDPPLQFVEGVNFSDDANVNAVIAYTCGP